MVTTTTQLAEIFYGSSVHQTFNATVALAGAGRLDILLVAAELDAEEFLIRHPELWHGADPCELATTLANDFVERWHMICSNRCRAQPANT